MHRRAEEFLALYEQGLHHGQIAARSGVKRGTVNYILLTHPRYQSVVRPDGKPRWTEERKTEVIRLYTVERLGLNDIARRLRFRTASVRAILRDAEIPIRSQSEQQSGIGNPCWRGGRKLDGGYWYRYLPEHPMATLHGYVLEHRLVMEDMLGRFLSRSEVVHHKDDDTQNNSPDNLELFASNADHLRATISGKPHQVSAEGRRRLSEAVKKRHREKRLCNASAQRNPSGQFSSMK